MDKEKLERINEGIEGMKAFNQKIKELHNNFDSEKIKKNTENIMKAFNK